MNHPTPPPQSRCPVVTRRDFIAALGAGAAAVAAGPFALSLWGGEARAAAPVAGAFGPGVAGRTLVLVELGGGNDGLGMVIPQASSAYHDLRGTLVPDGVLDLDGEIGLHPALASLACRWNAGELAVVEGVGYPEPDLSHFASMSTWWTGDPSGGEATGWLGRYLDGIEDTGALGGVAIGPGPSPALRSGRAVTATIRDRRGLAPDLPPWIDEPAELLGLWEGFVPATPEPGSTHATVGTAIDGALLAAARVEDALAASPAPQGDDPRPGSLAASLDVAAALIAAPVPPRVIVVHGWGDFDTHRDQSVRHAALMEELDGGIARLLASVEASGKQDDVLVLTSSEFGRRPASNGSGTDHGTAAAHLVIGRKVNGGRYGEALDLDRLDPRGNPTHTVDYRSVYATVLDGWLGVDHHEILGGGHEDLGFFTPAAQSTTRRIPVR